MSVMFWLFGLGAAAAAFPFLFHLIRRTPKGQTQFSSLMFLKSTPPNLTRRSRLENYLLLLMRMAVIGLVALAFTRPFFRGTDNLSLDNVSNQRVVILLDTSASMQRGNLWALAKDEVGAVLDELDPKDAASLLSFDDQVRSIVAFDELAGTDQLVSINAIRKSLTDLQPGWARSDLGRALVSVADQLAIWRDAKRSEEKTANAKLQIVVVSDLQKGSRTERLQSYQWPADVFVEFRTLSDSDSNNATVQVLNPVEESDEPPTRRIRVRNSEESTGEQFFVNWHDANQNEGEPIPFFVPPGTSRVLELDVEKSLTASEFFLSGDSDSFDNSFYVVPPQRQDFRVAYLSDDEPDDPEQMLFYLSRGLVATPTRTIEVGQLDASSSLLDTQSGFKATLAVVSSELNEDRSKEVDEFLAAGGTLLVVLKDSDTIESTSQWTLAERTSASADDQKQKGDRSDYAMLGEVDFSHSLFAPFDSPRFNDFTTIRFWNHRSVKLPEDAAKTDSIKVLARFDDQSPAVWQHKPATGGTVIALASGWHPVDSQLALSTKFVPILNGILDIAINQPDLKTTYVVNEPLTFNASDSGSRTMTGPDKTQVKIDRDQTTFADTGIPGIYRLSDGNKKSETAAKERDVVESDDSASPVDVGIAAASDVLFAVNVDRAESETVAIPIEQLEMLELNIGRQESGKMELAQLRLLRDREIEDRQKMWKWLIVAALVLLVGETWLAGRTAVRQVASDEPAAIDLSGGTA